MNNIDFDEESEKLIQSFKKFEKIIKCKAIESGISIEENNLDVLINKLCEKNPLLKRNKDEIDIIRKIRNLNSHNSGREYKYVVCPSPEINNRLEKIINDIENPPMIFNTEMCIKRKDICFKTLGDTIWDTIRVMTEKMYTHIPILESEKLIGVFSENTLLDVIKNESGIIIDNNTKFETILEYLKIKNHSMEEFEFISRKKNVYEVEEIFKEYFKKNKRIGCVYVTENGKDTENILGMLTAWDILGA